MPHEVDMTKALIMSLRDWYETQTEPLPVKRVRLVVGQFTCETEYRPELGQEYACPSCKSSLHEIRSGRELKIERVEWEEQPCWN